MTQELAEQYARSMMELAFQARSVVRDLNPKVFLLFFNIHLFADVCVNRMN